MDPERTVVNGHWVTTASFDVALAFAGTLAGILSWRSWTRGTPGSKPFSLMTAAIALWCYLYGLEATLPGYALKVVLARAEYLAIATVPVWWLLFALTYTGRGRDLARRRVVLLLLVPAVTLGLVLSGDPKQLVWSRVFLVEGDAWTPLTIEHGPWFWVHLSYSYSLLLAGAAVLVEAVLRYPRHYRQQAALIMVAVVTPWLGNILYASGLVPHPNLDPTPFAFALSAAAFAWAMSRYRMLALFLGLRPLARSAAFQRMLDGVLVLDADDRVVDLNPAASSMLGLPGADITGSHVTDLLGCSFATSGVGVGAPGGPKEFRRKEEGGVRIYEALVSSFPRAQGSRSGGLVMLHDVTESRRSEEAIKKSEEHLRNLLNALPCGVLFIQEGGILEANPEARRILGLGPDEAIPHHDLFSLTHPNHREELEKRLQAWAALRRAGAGGKPVEERIVRRDGSEVWVELSGTPLTARGRPGFSVLLIDITARKAAEVALNKSEELLRQSQKLEAVGQLAGGIAHDFNNLLTAIGGFADMISPASQDGRDPEEAVQEIKKAAAQAAALTRQLLAFSRRQTLKPRVLDLNEAVGRMTELLRRTLGEDIEFVCRLGFGLGAVEADPGQIEQVVLNLVVNARDAMRGGGLLVVETAAAQLDEDFVVAHPGARAGPHVLLKVQDSGCGMDEETKERLFEPFFTTKAFGVGTGLGLSTVYGIVKQSGGSIWVESEIGKGSTIKVYLPRVEKAVDWPVPEVPCYGETTAGTEAVLVLEDEPSVRRLVSRVLRQHGYRVAAAASPREALALAEGQSFDLLLSDVVLPEMSGPDVAARLVQSQPDCARLFMSGYSRAAVSTDGELREDELLEKPFAPELLARRVRAALDSRPCALGRGPMP